MNRSNYVKCIAIFLIGLLLSFFHFKSQNLHYDNTQILDRVAAYFFHDQWIHFGNAATGVGFVPGSLITFVNVMAMKIYFSVYSMMVVVWIFHLVALVLIYSILKKIDKNLLLSFLILFWLNPWRIDQTTLFNPSYIFLFSALHLWTSLKMVEKSFYLSFLHILCLGFCAQVHLSFVVLVILSFFLWFFKYIKIHWLGFFSGVLVVALSLYPWLMAVLFDPPFRQADFEVKKSFLFKNTVLVFPIFKSVLYWLRYSSTYFSSNIFMDMSFGWVEQSFLKYFFVYPFMAVKYVFAILSLYFSALLHWQIFKNIKVSLFKRTEKFNFSTDHRIGYYVGYLFLAVILATMISPIEFNHWHLLVAFPASMIVMVLGLSKLQSERIKIYKLVITSVAIFFIIFNILASIESRSHNINNDYSELAQNYLQQKK